MQGIIMQGPSVLSTLAGNKTQTRRVMKEQPLTAHDHVEFDGIMTRDAKVAFFAAFQNGSAIASQSVKIPHPVGALRYIKENFYICRDVSLKRFFYGYVAGSEKKNYEIQSGLFMPERFSRCQIKITGVHVERVRSITDGDVMSEGCLEKEYINGFSQVAQYSMDGLQWFREPYKAYKHYFIKINGAKAWESNPWVFVYDYEVIWKK